MARQRLKSRSRHSASTQGQMGIVPAFQLWWKEMESMSLYELHTTMAMGVGEERGKKREGKGEESKKKKKGERGWVWGSILKNRGERFIENTHSTQRLESWLSSLQCALVLQRIQIHFPVTTLDAYNHLQLQLQRIQCLCPLQYCTYMQIPTYTQFKIK